MSAGSPPRPDDGAHAVTSLAALEALYGQPSGLAATKVIGRLDTHARHMIAHSPFLILSTAAADGTVDASPKGDAPGFVQVLDDQTLAVPDRPGNNRLDGLRNIVENPEVGLLFLVPGLRETLRINGPARLSTDPALLQPMAVNGKVPKLAIVVTAREVFLHCGKALIRSHLWDPQRQVPAGTFPSLARMVLDQVEAPATAEDLAAHEARIADSYATRLY